MSDNAGGWPPVPPGPPGSQAPQGFPRPLPSGYEPVHHEFPPTDPRFDDRRRAEDSPWRRAEDSPWRRAEDSPWRRAEDSPWRRAEDSPWRRAEDSPWRRAERLSHPEAAGWPAGAPGPASYSGDPRGLDGGQFHSPGQDGGRDDDAQYRDPGPAGRYDGPEVYGQYTDDDGYDTGDRFVPGFADYGDEDQGGRGTRRRTARRPGPRGQGPAGPRGPRRRRWRWIAPLAALLIILIPVAVGGAYAYSLYMSKYHPADYSGPGTGHVVVQVSSGDTPTSLGPKLQQLGVVASARAFVLAAEHSSNPNGLLPGFYGMHEHMQASLAYALLLNPKNLVQITVTIPEGWRLSQIVSWLGEKSGIPASAYNQVLKDPARLNLPPYADGKPEGYLFPATYEVVPHETAFGVLSGMVQRFDQEAAAVNLPAAARQVHLTQGQVIIMASLVQAEGGRLSDYPKIARVIYNRLAQGIPLQLDSTVLYGLDTYGIMATNAQLTSDSPYNTYRHMGLTPGPIDNPGNAAIQAVLHPASGNWVYFVTVNPKTGETLFTSSAAQFQQFRAELEHNLGQG